MTWPRAVALATAAATAVMVTGFAVADADEDSGRALGPGLVTVELDIEHSRFSADHLVVREGTQVRFVVRNSDPINHELIVGDDQVHRRHASGTEREHPPVPGEVSVGAHDVATTVFTFDEVGDVVFACHLPGHVAFGMEGVVEVVPT